MSDLSEDPYTMARRLVAVGVGIVLLMIGLLLGWQWELLMFGLYLIGLGVALAVVRRRVRR